MMLPHATVRLCRRGRDMPYTGQVISDRLQWLHPQVKKDIPLLRD